MNVKNTIKALCKSNPVTSAIYKRIAYARADYRELRGVVRPIRKAMREKPDAVFLVMTPEHGNLGDHAIALAEKEMLQRVGMPYIEIPISQLGVLQKNTRLNIMNGRSILVNGGGNLGTLWFGVEELFRFIIHANPCSQILTMPNTMFYENNEWGKRELENSISVYNAHPYLKLYAREKISYHQMKSLYRNVQLMPDMVMLLNKCQANIFRNGCLLCLRNDCERTRTEAEEQTVVAQAKLLFGENVQYTDMCVDYKIPVEHRERELEAKFSEFRSAKLVITDRLHGMIFCAITGTPCIVINSKSHKVRGCYEWIQHLDYIRFCDNLYDIGDIYRTIPQEEHHYRADHLMPYYEKLMADIEQTSRR